MVLIQNGNSAGNSSFDPSAPFKFGMWTPLKLAMYIATNDAPFYQKYGGNLQLFAIVATANSPSGMPTGTDTSGSGTSQEMVQEEDALGVATRMLQNLQDLFQEMVRLGLYFAPNTNDLDWMPSDDVDAIANGILNGASIEQAQFGLYKIGYGTTALRGGAIRGIMGGYGHSIGAPNFPPFLSDWSGGAMSYTEILEYLNSNNGLVYSSSMQGVPVVEIGNEKVWVCIDSATAKNITTQLVALRPTPQIPPKSWMDVVTLRAVQFQGEGLVGPNAPYSGAGIGFAYLTLAYRLWLGDPRDSGLTLLALTSDELTRFVAVQIEGKALINKAINTAYANGILFTMSNLVSSMPTAPSDLAQLSPLTMPPCIPKRLETWIKLGYAGNNPLILVSQGGLPVSTSDYLRGQPATSVIGLDRNVIIAMEEAWRSELVLYALNGGNQYVDFSSLPNGNPTEWGSLLKNPVNPDGSPALPWFSDNSAYSDITDSDLTDIQKANVFQMAVASDPSRAIPLGLVQGVNVGDHNSIANGGSQGSLKFRAQFYANPNNVALRDAWLRVAIRKAFTGAAGTIQPVGFGPMPPVVISSAPPPDVQAPT